MGFKWFVDGLLDGSLGFGGEESAGASFLRRDGSVWTTDKDGIVLGLLAAEMTAVTGRDPGDLYGGSHAGARRSRSTGASTPRRPPPRRRSWPGCRLGDVTTQDLAGEPIAAMLTTAPGGGPPIGGLKVVTASGWFAARPSGTEEVYKLYAESFKGEAASRPDPGGRPGPDRPSLRGRRAAVVLTRQAA